MPRLGVVVLNGKRRYNGNEKKAAIIERNIVVIARRQKEYVKMRSYMSERKPR